TSSGSASTITRAGKPRRRCLGHRTCSWIRSADKRHVHTVELSYQTSSSLDDKGWASIISLNAAYTYFQTYAEFMRDYNQSNSLAVFMVEANYELENNTGHDGSPSTTGEPGNSCRQAETATEPATGSSSWKCRASPCSGSGPPAARRLQGLNIGLLSA